MRWKCHPNHAGALPTLDGREWRPPALAITLYYPNTPTSRWRPTCEDGGTGWPAGSCRSSCSRQGAGYIHIYVDELRDRTQDKRDNGPPEDFIVALQECILIYLKGCSTLPLWSLSYGQAIFPYMWTHSEKMLQKNSIC